MELKFILLSTKFDVYAAYVHLEVHCFTQVLLSFNVILMLFLHILLYFTFSFMLLL